jgi:hypothetical protein
MVGGKAVIGGTLWTMVAGAGFGLVLLGLKVFPVVVIAVSTASWRLVGALAIGVLESLHRWLRGPLVGAGFSSVVPYLLLLGVCSCGPGDLGRPEARRI